jgi:hypothetical protein
MKRNKFKAFYLVHVFPRAYKFDGTLSENLFFSAPEKQRSFRNFPSRARKLLSPPWMFIEASAALART